MDEITRQKNRFIFSLSLFLLPSPQRTRLTVKAPPQRFTCLTTTRNSASRDVFNARRSRFLSWVVFLLKARIFLLQNGVGGDNRAEDKGAHVRQSDDRRVRLGSATRSQRVSTTCPLKPATPKFLSLDPRSFINPAPSARCRALLLCWRLRNPIVTLYLAALFLFPHHHSRPNWF